MRRAPDATAAGRGRGERGTALVELAVVLPLLALLFLTAIDLGLAIREGQVLQNAAREAARFSSLQTSWLDPVRNPTASRAAIEQRVVDYCLREGITVSAAAVSIDQRYPIRVGGLTLGGSEVIVSYERPFLIPGAPLLPFARVRLTGRAVFRNLY
jgi:hypothetical protein